MWNLTAQHVSTMVGHLIYFAVVISTAVTEATSQAKCENAFSCWKGEKRGVCTGIGQTINATKDNETTCWCEEYNGYSPDRPKECWEQGTPSACVCTQCPNGSGPIIRKENCEFIAEFNKEEHCIPISDNAQGSCAPPAKCTITTSAPPAKSNITTSDFHVSNAVWAILVLEIIICIGVGVIIYKLSLKRPSPAPSPPPPASVTLSSADIQQVLHAVTSLNNRMVGMEASLTWLRTTFSAFRPSSSADSDREVDLHPTLRDTQV